MGRNGRTISEAVLLGLTALAPWAFGAVTAWAELVLYLGVALAALAAAAAGGGAGRWRVLTCVPSLAWAGLVVLALAQSTARWPVGVAGRVFAPAATALRAALAPATPARVVGDPGSRDAPPAPAASEDPDLTRDAAARLAAGWALFVAVLAAGGGTDATRRLGLTLAGTGALLALFAVIQTLSWNGRMYWVLFPVEVVPRGGPFLDKNHLAAYLNLGLGFALAALLTPGWGRGGREDRGEWYAAASVAGLIVVGVVASLSRCGFVGMTVATAALLGVTRPKSVRTVVGLAVALGLAAAFLAVAGPVGASRRIATLLDAGTYAGRFGFWRAGLRAWSGSPLWGLGLGSFGASAARCFARDEGEFVPHAENEYVEVLAEGGVVGLALALVLLATVVGLGARAVAAARDPGRRVGLLGALFGVVALATQCLADFPLHVPAVAFPAVLLAAHLTRAGLDARRPVAARGEPARSSSSPGRFRWAAAGWVVVVVSLFALWHGVEMAGVESELAAGGVPPPDFEMPTTTLWDAPLPRLARTRAHLEGALRHRPDWAEGHARLGIVCLSQYRRAVAELVAAGGIDPARAAVMADPVWLHHVVHSARPDELAAVGGVLPQEPVRLYLVPAARSFLEARRCCPVWGLPHAELASLDYLLTGGESTSAHARRALLVAGADSPTVALAARAAAQAGDLGLAARCWRRLLELSGSNWPGVAAQARAALTPEQILGEVVPDGVSVLRFAEEVYTGPADRPARDRFLAWAAGHLPGDTGLPEAQRLRLAARAQFGLGRPGPAREQMLAALALEPRQARWRKDLVEWLIGWGKLDEAHDQAVLGLHLTPGDPDALRAAELAAEALARGATPPAPAFLP